MTSVHADKISDPFDCGAATDTELARMWLGAEAVAAAQSEVAAGRQSDLAAALSAAGHLIQAQVEMLRGMPRARILDRFELLERIHAGASAEVHLAREVGLGREVALKLVTRIHQDDAAFLARFEREGALTEPLSHPNIARCLGRGTSGGQPWMALEFVRGPTLAALLKTHGPIAPLLAVDAAMQVASGLSLAWSVSRLVHRDICPANLMVDRGRAAAGEGWNSEFESADLVTEGIMRAPFAAGEVVKIIGFGLARADTALPPAGSGSALTATGVALGTPAYMAPEQIAGQECDCRADIYSLGATLFHLLTGRPPYEGRSAVEVMDRQVRLPVPDPARLVADLDSAIASLVVTAMAKDPAARFQDPTAFIGAARAILHQDRTPVASLNVDGTATSDAELARQWLGSAVVAAAQVEVAAGRQSDLAAALLATGSIIEPQVEMLRGVPAARYIDRFELIAPLGSGAMGEVHLAREIGTGREAALKLVTDHLGDNRNFRRRFEREGELLEALDHINIARCLGRGVFQDQPWLAMEYVRGPDLAEMLRRQSSLPPRIAVGFAIQAAAGLAHAWSVSRLVHRDIKPSNLLIERGERSPTDPADAADRVKIIDFGLAKTDGGPPVEGSLLTMAGTVLGTPAYMAPEQVEGRECDCRTDIYSLGATLFHMLVGRTPFDGRTPVEVMAKHIKHPVPDPSRLVADLPPAVVQLVMKAMAKDPQRRFQSPTAFIAAAREAIGLQARAWSGPGATVAQVGGPEAGTGVGSGSRASPFPETATVRRPPGEVGGTSRQTSSLRRSPSMPAGSGAGTARYRPATTRLTDRAGVQPVPAPSGTGTVRRSSSSALAAALTDRIRRTQPATPAVPAPPAGVAPDARIWERLARFAPLAAVVFVLALFAVVVLSLR